MAIQTILAFFSYFAILLSIGIIFHKKQTSNAEFIVGNRSLNYWLTALSAHASDMSAWLFMGLPMAVYVSGLSASWIAFGLLLGMYLNWRLVAKRLRISTERYNCCTLSSYFEKRFNDKSGTLRLLSAIILVFFLIHYIAATLTAMGQIFESVFHIDYYVGLTFATFVIVIYTFVGGFVTIAWTDLFQALFLLFAIILTPIVAYFYMGEGANRLIELTAKKEGFLSFLDQGITSASITTAVLTALSWGLGYFGMPHIITKFMGIKDPQELKKSMYLGMGWQFLALGTAVLVGIIGAAFFEEQLDNPQLVFIDMVKAIFNPFFGGLILCGVVAANLSTMDSQLLVCASAIGEDLYSHFGKKNATAQEKVRVTQGAVIVVALTSLIISFGKSKAVLDTVFYAWAGLGASFGPLVLASLYLESANKYGAVAGIVIGGLVACFWHLINPYVVDYEIPSMIPAFFLGFFTIIVVSLASKRNFLQQHMI
jgi:sodium/proline symporter